MLTFFALVLIFESRLDKAYSYFIALSPDDRSLDANTGHHSFKRNPFILPHNFLAYDRYDRRQGLNQIQMHMPSLFMLPSVGYKKPKTTNTVIVKRRQSAQPYRPSRYIVRVG